MGHVPISVDLMGVCLMGVGLVSVYVCVDLISVVFISLTDKIDVFSP